jgi:DNA invertase Pin-like site-specific DNA recombinase
MATKTKRAALYLRVSTGDQTTENQRRELEAAAEQRGWTVVTTYLRGCRHQRVQGT